MMKVEKDLFMYQRGVYSSSGLTSGETASHSVRILGWGEEASGTGQPTKYWVSLVSSRLLLCMHTCPFAGCLFVCLSVCEVY